MSSDEQETYITRLAKLGYCWQFITLAGLHTTALISRKPSSSLPTPETTWLTKKQTPSPRRTRSTA